MTAAVILMNGVSYGVDTYALNHPRAYAWTTRGTQYKYKTNKQNAIPHGTAGSLIRPAELGTTPS